MKKLFALIILFYLHLQPLCSQNLFGQYNLEYWDTRKGLPTNQVLNLSIDQAGYLWISGYDGLIRFDGQRFKIFDVSTNPEFIVNNTYLAFMDTQQVLWVTSINNTVMAFEDGKFTKYQSPWPIARPEIILKQEGILFYNENNEFILFDCKTRRFSKLNEAQLVRTIKANISRYGIVGDQKGRVFFACKRRLYSIQNNQLVKLFNDQNTAFNSFASISSELFKDSNGQIHLITDLGHRIWNGTQFVPHPSTAHLHFQTFGSSRKPLIVEDQQHNLWIASVQGLVLRRHGQQQFEFLHPDHPLNKEFINSMVVDRENNLWLATESGLYKVSKGKVRVYSIYDGLSTKRVTAVAAPDSGVYLLNTPGIQNFYRLEKGQLRPFKLRQEPPRSIEIFQTFTDSKKRTWMVTGGALIVIYPDQSNRIYYPSETIRYVTEDREGNIWLGCANKGIGQWVGDSVRMLHFPGFSFADKAISSIHRYGKKGWLITTFNAGVILIDDQQRAKHYFDTLGMPPIGAFDAAVEPNGHFWLPTSLGLYYWNGQRFLPIIDQKGYLQYNIFDIVADQLGNFWLPSNRGIIEVKKTALLQYVQSQNPQPILANLLDEGDGMLTRQCVGARHSVLTPDGKILVPTFLGLVEVDPRSRFRNRIPPKVLIDPIRFDGKVVPPDQAKVFPPGNHQYILSYGALSTTAPSKVRYRYRLDGYKNYWSELSADDRITYTNLPAGRYTFRVKAANNDGLWSQEEATYTFTVRPFFYQTWWFWLLSALILALGIQTYIRLNNRNIVLKNEELERTVTHRTQELQEANQHLETQKNALEETLTHLQTTQAQLIQSEKLASLGELTAGIAHEIQNPLNFVNNFAEVSIELLAEMHTEMEAGNYPETRAIANDLEQNLQKINHHGRRASSIVKSMLDHSRQGRDAINRVSTDINALADEYLRLAYHGWRAKQHGFNCTLETYFEPALPLVAIVPQEIGRVLLNLLNNAFYAVNEKTKTKPTAYEPTVILRTQTKEDRIEISIEDNGSGIPAAIQEKIFQPFFTTKPSGHGTGLGLSLAYDIVTKGHSGTLEVRSNANGTTFTLGFPLHLHET